MLHSRRRRIRSQQLARGWGRRRRSIGGRSTRCDCPSVLSRLLLADRCVLLNICLVIGLTALLSTKYVLQVAEKRDHGCGLAECVRAGNRARDSCPRTPTCGLRIARQMKCDGKKGTDISLGESAHFLGRVSVKEAWDFASNGRHSQRGYRSKKGGCHAI